MSIPHECSIMEVYIGRWKGQKSKYCLCPKSYDEIYESQGLLFQNALLVM